MNGKYLLDTNIVIALFANDKNVIKNLKNVNELFIPGVVLGELYFGACKSGRVRENLARIDEFAANSIVLGCDTETSRYYGKIKNAIQTKGHPIPENDIWIAAIAIQHNLILISRDKHFEIVENLRLERW